ncbi:MAG: winged helix-turn-helix domain-containing protein [Candidatus Korobacteraceae bacterium]
MDSRKESDGIFRFGVFEIDLGSGELRKNGVRVKVQDVPLRALRLFLSRPQEVLSREELRRALWDENVFVDFDRSINTAVNRLRETLGDTASNPRFIETVSRSGYRWVAPIQVVPRPKEEIPGAEELPVSLPAGIGGDLSQVARPLRERYIVLTLAVAVAAIGLGFGLLLMKGRATPRDSSTRSAAQSITSSSKIKAPVESAHDAEAQRLYLEGRFYWDKRTPESLNKAVDLFTQAIVHDPNYAPAYTGLADCYNLLREYGTMPAKEAYPRALAAARRAVELDDSSAQAHLSLAFATFYGNLDARDAEREFHRAIELDPRSATAHHWYGTFLCALGRYPQAEEQLEIAQQLEPGSISILADKAFVLLYSDQREQGIELLKQLEQSQPEFVPTYRYLETVCLMNKDYRCYMAARLEVAKLTNNQQELAIAKAAKTGYGSGQQQGMWKAILKKQQEFYGEGTLPAFDLAATYSQLGMKPQALHYLNVALANHEPQIVALHDSTLFAGLREESAFQSFVTRLDLP